jgi:tRNA (guanine37-N1)-methyltransferase
MRVLDRSFFKKTIPLTAARIFDDRNIARVQKECKNDTLRLKLPMAPRLREDPDMGGRKLLLLKPEVKHDGMQRNYSYLMW